VLLYLGVAKSFATESWSVYFFYQKTLLAYFHQTTVQHSGSSKWVPFSATVGKVEKNKFFDISNFFLSASEHILGQFPARQQFSDYRLIITRNKTLSM